MDSPTTLRLPGSFSRCFLPQKAHPFIFPSPQVQLQHQVFHEALPYDSPDLKVLSSHSNPQILNYIPSCVNSGIFSCDLGSPHQLNSKSLEGRAQDLTASPPLPSSGLGPQQMLTELRVVDRKNRPLLGARSPDLNSEGALW